MAWQEKTNGGIETQIADRRRETQAVVAGRKRGGRKAKCITHPSRMRKCRKSSEQEVAGEMRMP